MGVDGTKNHRMSIPPFDDNKTMLNRGYGAAIRLFATPPKTNPCRYNPTGVYMWMNNGDCAIQHKCILWAARKPLCMTKLAARIETHT